MDEPGSIEIRTRAHGRFHRRGQGRRRLRDKRRRPSPPSICSGAPIDDLLVQSTGVLEPLPAAELRLGRRTLLTLPLLPPPQKNRSPPSDSSPDTPAPGGILKALQNLSRSRIEPPQIASVAFPRGVPEFAVDPGDPGDETVGLDGAKNRPGLRIDFIDFPVPILPHPERPLGPREPRVAAGVGRPDYGEHTAGFGIDLLDAILGDLIEVLSVEGGSCMRGDSDRAQHLPRCRIEGVQLVSGRKPDALTVKRDPATRSAPGKGPYSRRISAAEQFMSSS